MNMPSHFSHHNNVGIEKYLKRTFTFEVSWLAILAKETLSKSHFAV